MRNKLQLTRLRPRAVEAMPALGPWCTNGDGPGAVPVLPAPTSTDDLDQARQELTESYHAAMVQVADWLGEIHGLDRDLEYWELLCYRSVTYLVKEYYLRDRYLRRALERYPELLPVTLHPDDYDAPATDPELSAWHTRSDLFNLQLFSQVAASMGVQCICLPASDFVGVENDSARADRISAEPWWIRLLEPIRTLVQQPYPPAGPDQIALFPAHFPAAVEARLSKALGHRLHRAKLPRLRIRHSQINSQLRRNMKVTVAAAGWTRGLLQSIAINLPRDYVEDFPRNRRVAEKVVRRGRPALIVGAYFRGVAERIWIAESRMGAHGSRLVIIQHGGGYGEAAGPFVRWADVELRLADTFVSWGWGAGEPGVAPLSAPRLLKAAQLPREETKTILVVSGPVRRYPTFEHFLGAPTPWETHERFFGALPAELRRNSVFRGHPHTAGDLEEQAPWSPAYPEVTVDLAEAQLTQLLADARIVVISNPFSTTFLECLAMDRPVVVLSDGHRPEVSDRARHLYQRLEDVGIVFTSAITAADAVARAYGDIHGWWGEPDRRAVVEEFTQTFARVASEPVREWAEFLRREARAQTTDRLSMNRAQQL